MPTSFSRDGIKLLSLPQGVCEAPYDFVDKLQLEMPLYGECMCGGVTVTVQDQPADKTSAYCHCLNCKKQSGASKQTWHRTIVSPASDIMQGGTLIMAVANNEVQVEGTTKIYEDRKTDSGTLLHRVFCENCGS